MVTRFTYGKQELCLKGGRTHIQRFMMVAPFGMPPSFVNIGGIMLLLGGTVSMRLK